MNTERFRILIEVFAWTIGVIAGIVGIFSIPFEHIKKYLIEEHNWSFPLSIILSAGYFVLIGVLISTFIINRRLQKGKRNGFWDLIKVEKGAKEVWVLTHNISYDLKNDEFIGLIRDNLKRHVKYKYIVPDNSTMKEETLKYKEIYNLDDKDYGETFSFYQEGPSTKFVFDLVIFNPYESDRQAFLFSVINNEANDYIWLDKEKSVYYKDLFEKFLKEITN